MKRILGSLLLLLFLLSSAIAQINVVPLKDSELQIKKNSLIYSLPRVTININIIVETEYFFPGPYQKYADKYLTIKNTSSDPDIKSKIVDIRINSVTEPDPNATFLVIFKKNEFLLNYCSSSIIKSYGMEGGLEKSDEFDTNLSIPSFNDYDVIFTDMSVKRNFIDVTDTTYRVIQVDSIFQKIPIYNKVITSKEFEQKAEEAANYLIKIRKRKFKLMTGQFETETPPSDVNSMIAELEELEQEYLSLFIGKTIKVENSFNFKYTPEGNVKEKKIVLFHLSDEFGIVEEERSDSQPVYLLLTNNSITSEIDSFYNRQTELKKKDKNKGLFYRIPGYASVKVIYDDMQYVEQVVMVPQYGVLNYLPANMFKSKSLKILFDENSGSVKTISNE